MDRKGRIELSKGCLIVFEGIDGTGKSTQLSLLAETLSLEGYSVVATREPTDGYYGRKIRNLYINRDKVSREEELELFLLDRKDHVESFLLPHLAHNKIVLCDRYYLSTIAYQGAAGMDMEIIRQKNSFAPEPDIALLFQLTPHASTRRITQKRGDKLNDFEKEDYLTEVEKIFTGLDYPFIHTLDASRSIQTIHRDVFALVDQHLRDLRITP